jgi:hypothetical protein
VEVQTKEIGQVAMIAQTIGLQSALDLLIAVLAFTPIIGHTFIIDALARGRTLAEGMEAAGHCNVSITLCYVHVAVEHDGPAGELFAQSHRQLNELLPIGPSAPSGLN